MVIAGYAVELIFGGLGLVPDRSAARIPDSGVSWDYTTWLNIAFLLLAAVIIVRFVRTGGLPMLRMMGGPADGQGHDHAAHDHAAHDHAAHDHAAHDHAAHDHAAHDHAAHDHAAHDHAAHDHAAHGQGGHGQGGHRRRRA
jgi:hypothetical protein